MSKYSGTAFSVMLVDGYNLVPSLSESVDMGSESLTEETNPFGVSSKGHSPIGLSQGELNVGNGFYDAVTDALHSAVGTVVGIARVVSAAIFGNVIGRPFIGFQGAYSQAYKVIVKKDGLTMANVKYLVSGEVEEGVIVQHLATFTADWDTKTGGANAVDAPVDYTLDKANRVFAIATNSVANPTVVTMKTENGAPIQHGLTSGQKVLFSGSNSTPTINGERVVTVISPITFSVPVNVSSGGTAGTFVRANSVGGGAGYLHCTEMAATSLLGKIMHSPDDVTYAALVTFATLLAIGKERKTAAGTVDRYLSFNGDHTGAGNVTVFSGFCRY